MAAFVVDANVAIVANGQSSQANLRCELSCVKALKTAKVGLVCIDDKDRILKEYRRYLSPSGQPGVGDEFMQWLVSNQYNENVCERVSITEAADGDFFFNEFPAESELVGFDQSDQKYAAVAFASRNSPCVLNATDSDWRDFQGPFERNGLRIIQLCLDCIKAGP